MNNSDVLKVMLAPREELSYGTGYALNGFSVRYKESTVLLILKAKGSLEGHQVTFVEAATLEDCWAFVASACYTSSVKLAWRADQYASG